ncbi:hypothetical protein [uncultured Kordia sp.]|uniref:hypothetical protein n=1 Tax=uncultured Kordia sp. TaxID=507699 RepID=UPI0026250C5F|nr:hypothetical protein [uncultured Kordia sp.]
MKKLELIQELVSYIDYHEEPYTLKYLKRAEEEFGEDILVSLVRSILRWQKRMINYQPLRNVHYDNVKKAYPLDEIELELYTKLFKYCPELSELFIIENSVMMYNTTLTDEEKTKLMVLSDKIVIDHKIRITRKRPWRK